MNFHFLVKQTNQLQFLQLLCIAYYILMKDKPKICQPKALNIVSEHNLTHK